MKLTKKHFELISKIADEHSKKIFGYLSREDLKNEIWVVCLDKIKDYNKDIGPLENFLRVAVKNRLINKFKEITKSVRSPCPRCKYNIPKEKINCSKFGPDKHLCNKWKNYQLSVDSRNSLLNAVDTNMDRPITNNPLDISISNEIKKLILSKIHKDYLMDFKTLISGGKVSQNKLKNLKKEILNIIESQEMFTVLTINGKNPNA